MARRPRTNLEGVPQHIIQRGNNRQACFFSKDDYTVYLDKLLHYSKKYVVDVHAFVLMTNHVHLLMTPNTKHGISQLMQSLGRYYVRYVNQVHGRTGTLWEGRYKSTLVDSEQYLLVLYRYIELNPVRAGMVEHPSEYPWPSFHHNAMNKKIQLVVPHTLYQSLGTDKESRRAAYVVLFDSYIPETSIQRIRDCTNKAWLLGDDDFKLCVEQKTGKKISISQHGGDRKSELFNKNHNQ